MKSQSYSRALVAGGKKEIRSGDDHGGVRKTCADSTSPYNRGEKVDLADSGQREATKGKRTRGAAPEENAVPMEKTSNETWE